MSSTSSHTSDQTNTLHDHTASQVQLTATNIPVMQETPFDSQIFAPPRPSNIKCELVRSLSGTILPQGFNIPPCLDKYHQWNPLSRIISSDAYHIVNDYFIGNNIVHVKVHRLHLSDLFRHSITTCMFVQTTDFTRTVFNNGEVA